ncbi:hypothetical protein [Bacillus chungangensis]|uniref:Uncharacterized protein n=1 Tax=Bacillus chungangensis TaxID=587633 RepID=A0ABT9WYT5_9BACI|nr:hypothetical protein [Bacillus chungangensis]MDQ0178466.1 hypothetical protein [Bacillus chungangensis]
MKLNKFIVSAILYFKSGNSKKIDWVEDRLVKKIRIDEKEETKSLTLQEANIFFQGKFKEWKDKGTTIVRKNVKGQSSIIAFSEIEYATVTINQVGVSSLIGDQDVKPSTLSKHQESLTVKAIKDHPAFKP